MLSTKYFHEACTNTLNKKDALAFFKILPLFIFIKQKTKRDSESFSKDGAFAKKPQVSSSFCMEVMYGGRKKPRVLSYALSQNCIAFLHHIAVFVFT